MISEADCAERALQVPLPLPGRSESPGSLRQLQLLGSPGRRLPSQSVVDRMSAAHPGPANRSPDLQLPQLREAAGETEPLGPGSGDPRSVSHPATHC